jgi:hypothetical protein
MFSLKRIARQPRHPHVVTPSRMVSWISTPSISLNYSICLIRSILGKMSSLEVMIYQATNNGLPPESAPTFRRLGHNFEDIWSSSLQAGPPADVPPLAINLRSDAVPVRVRARCYIQNKRDFLGRFVAKLVAAGMIYRNPRAAWCSV